MFEFGRICCPKELQGFDDDFWDWVHDNYRPDCESRLTKEQIEQEEKHMLELWETYQLEKKT